MNCLSNTVNKAFTLSVCLLVLMCMLTITGKAQNQAVLKTAEAYILKSEELSLNLPDSSFYYASKALNLCNTILKVNPGNIQASGTKGRALNLIVFHYFNQSKTDTALSLGMEAFQLLLKDGDLKNTSSACSNIAAIYENNGRITESETFFKKSLYYAEKAKDSMGIADSYNSLAYLNQRLGNIVKAINYFQRALDLQKHIHDTVGYATTLFNMGVTLSQQGEDSISTKYVKDAVRAFVEIGDKQAECNALYHLATFNKNESESFLYNTKALQLAREINDYKIISLCLAKIVNYKIKKKEYTGLKALCMESLSCAEKSGFPYTRCTAYQSMARVHYSVDNNYNKALDFALKAYQLSLQTGYSNDKHTSAALLSKIYKQKGDYKNALEYLTIYYSINDSIKNSQTQKAAIRQQFKMDYDIKAQKLKDQNAYEKRLILNQTEADKKRRNVILYSVSIVSLLLIILVIITLRHLKINRQKNVFIEAQKKRIEAKQSEIIDSINYAKRIQNAILAREESIRKIYPESFLLYRPKDIIAGDFYFFEETSNHVFYAVADCTGHGVPGALVSVVCAGALNRAVREFGLTIPGNILDKVRELVIETLKKSGSDIRDGMDISLMVKTKNDQSFSWAGANNPIWYFKDGELVKLTGNKQPVGLYEKTEPFTTHMLPLLAGDSFYMFTDGFADQFGGPKGKKFKLLQLEELLIRLQSISVPAQMKQINLAFDNWKGKLEQVDDVCIIGVKVS